MKRVYQKRELDAMAAKFTRAAPEEVKKRFKVPICGTLTCTFAGVAKPDSQELIVYDTQVVFEWRLRSPHVQGVISQALEAHRAMRMLSGHFVPFGMKRPLVAAHLYKKLCGRQRPLPAMKAPAVAETKVPIYAIAMAKQITEPLRKTILKRRGGAVEAPICAHISNERSLACVPADPGSRSLFHFHIGRLRSVVDDENRQPTIDAATHAKPLHLPADLSAYNKRPWRCLRDIVAHAHFRAEVIRARSEDRSLDIGRAMSGFDVCPFSWDAGEVFNDTMVFVIWTSGEGAGLKYHSKAVTLRRLCLQAGARKK